MNKLLVSVKPPFHLLSNGDSNIWVVIECCCIHNIPVNESCCGGHRITNPVCETRDGWTWVCRGAQWGSGSGKGETQHLVPGCSVPLPAGNGRAASGSSPLGRGHQRTGAILQGTTPSTDTAPAKESFSLNLKGSKALNIFPLGSQFIFHPLFTWKWSVIRPSQVWSWM